MKKIVLTNYNKLIIYPYIFEDLSMYLLYFSSGAMKLNQSQC